MLEQVIELGRTKEDRQIQPSCGRARTLLRVKRVVEPGRRRHDPVREIKDSRNAAVDRVLRIQCQCLAKKYKVFEAGAVCPGSQRHRSSFEKDESRQAGHRPEGFVLAFSARTKSCSQFLSEQNP